MIDIVIPDVRRICLKNAIFDMNGTLSLDGYVSESTRDKLTRLAKHVTIHVATADTFATADQVFACCPLTLTRIDGAASDQKLELLYSLGGDVTVAIGNGNNDVAMLRAATLAICVIGHEGAAVKALNAAHIVVTGFEDAIDLLLNPKRIVATLRG